VGIGVLVAGKEIMLVYLAGGVSGLTVKAAIGWREYVAERLSIAGIEVRDPLRGAEGEQHKLKKLGPTKDDSDDPAMSDKAFFTRDRWDVLTSDVILCNLAGAERVSIGSMFELAFGVIHNKLNVIVLDKSPKDLHDHVFVRESGVVFYNLDEAIDYILSCSGGERKRARRRSSAIHKTGQTASS